MADVTVTSIEPPPAVSVTRIDPPAPPSPDQVQVTGVTPPTQQGFWAEFKAGTGGWTGLAAAPFTESIPAEAGKALFHPSRTYATIENFLSKREDKPLTERTRESFETLVQLAKAHPGLAIGSLVHGLVSDPELFFLPELLAPKTIATARAAAKTLGAGARAEQITGAIAGGAARATGAAAIGGGATLLTELGEGEPIEPGKILSSAAIATPAALLQVRLRGEKPALRPEDIEREIGPAVSAPGKAVARIEPVAEGYRVRMEGQEGEGGMTFPTKAEADHAKTELDRWASTYRAMGTVPRGTSERLRLVFDNPFTDGVSQGLKESLVKRPKDVRLSRNQLLRFFATAGFSAGIGASLGAWLDRKDRPLGATFGAATVIVPAALRFVSPKEKALSVEDAVNLSNGTQAVMARHTVQFKAAIDEVVPTTERRTAISMALEGHPGIRLNPTEHAVAQRVREFFDALGNAAVDSGVMKEMLRNYVTHIVEDDPTAQVRGTIESIVDAILGKSRQPRPTGRQFAQHRQYATFGDLQEALRGSGLRIKTGDIGEIVAIYSRSMFKAITERRLIDALRRTPLEGMPSLIRPVAEVERPPPRAGETVEGEVAGERPTPERLTGPRRGVPTVYPQEGPGFQLPPEPPPGASAQKYAARQAGRTLVMGRDELAGDPNYVRGEGQLAGLAIHKDIAAQLNFLFSTKDPADWTLRLMAVNQATKRSMVSFSLFHANSLLQAFIPAMGVKAYRGTPGAQARRGLEMFLRGGSNEGIDNLLRAGMILKMPEDMDRNLTSLHRIAEIIDRALPVSAASKAANAVSRFNDALDRFTFEHLQTGFKIITGLDAYERLLSKGLSREAAAKLAASYVNDIYGSLDWFRVANDVGSKFGRDVVYSFFNPNGRRAMQILLFAPDWTVSTFRAAYKALPGAVDDPALAQLHRRYLAKSVLYYLTIANGINLLTAGHSIYENENPTRIQLADGRSLQFSKHFNEPWEWLREPMQTAANKLGFLPREAISQLLGVQYIEVHGGAPTMGDPTRTHPTVEARANHVAQSFLPIPVQQAILGAGSAGALGFFGVPAYGKDPEQRVQGRLQKRELAEQKRKEMIEYYRKLNQAR